MSYQPVTRVLFVVFAKQSALLQILATNAVPRPRYRIQALLRQCLAAVNTLAITRRLDPLECLINQIQHLAIVVRHRHQQFFCIRVRSHVGRILRSFSIAFAAIEFRGLHLADETLATVQ